MINVRRLLNKKREKGSVCSCCGKSLEGHLPALAFNAPSLWQYEFADKPGCELGSDFCVVDDESFFARVVLRIPIIDTSESLEWGVWVSLSKKNFRRYHDIFGTKAEQDEEPYFGWFANQLPGYPECTGIKTHVQLQGGNMRPLIILDHDNPHPICQEQHIGITLQHAHEIVDEALKT